MVSGAHLELILLLASLEIFVSLISGENILTRKERILCLKLSPRLTETRNKGNVLNTVKEPIQSKQVITSGRKLPYR